MVLMGYPGVGKSTFAKQKPYAIDLDSSTFHNIFELYVDVALSLSRQNKLVMISCHKEVYSLLRQKMKPTDNVGVLFPAEALKIKWLERLQKRYQESKLKKDERAYYRAMSFYEDDIFTISEGYDKQFKRYQIDSMKYDLSYNPNDDTFKLTSHRRKLNE